MESHNTALNRWRLVLGRMSAQQIGYQGSDMEITVLESMEDLLEYLYSRSGGDDVRTGSPAGGSGDSVLTTAEWITKVRRLFPKQTADVLERHALEEFQMTELLTDKKVLEKMHPDMNLLKSILQLKHLMHGEVLETAECIARQVAEELRERLENSVRQSIIGRIDRNASSAVKTARNLDIQKTIRKNLKNYDADRGEIILKNIYFSSRVKRHSQWRVILAIDQSGSMTGSVIYSAVMAQILADLPFADLRLAIFDTNIVDLTEEAESPARVLMSVQLGGGTDIGKALGYCESLINTPAKTCVIVVTDLYEGGSRSALLNTARNILESGARLNFLTALDENADAAYDRNLGQVLANMGAFVGGMTPEQLGDYIGNIFAG